MYNELFTVVVVVVDIYVTLCQVFFFVVISAEFN